MDDAEALKLSKEILEKTGEICTYVIDTVRRESEDKQMAIAMALIGRLFGTAYAATLQSLGPEGARLWAEELLMIAERTISELGGQVGFTITVKED